MGFYTIINQIAILGILALCGTLAFRLKVLSTSAKEVIEKLVFYITLPLLIITKLSTLDLSGEILRNGGFVIIASLFVFFIQILIGKLTSKLFKLEKRHATIHILHGFLGNIVFLGFPLLDALFPGGEAILYAALYQLSMNSVLWTYGIYQLNPSAKDRGFRSLKKLLNPNTIALVIGLSFILFGIKLPTLIHDSLGGLGKTSLYLAMIYIGILLGQIKVKEMINRADVFVLSFNKLLVVPILFIFIFKYTSEILNFEINIVAFSVVILETAMPCMTILVLLAKRYGADDQYAMKNFFVSTILSLLSLPFVLFMLELIMGN